MGPATAPCSTRNSTSISSEEAKPQSQEVSTNSSTLMVNRRTAPKRWVSQPVSGTEMALATPKLVMTQVPWLGLTPTSPEMAGMATLAMEESSTFMKVASDSASVPRASCAPLSGAMAGGMGRAAGAGGEAPAPGSSEVVEVMADSASYCAGWAAG